MARMVRAGTTETIEVTEPMTLVIGNTSKVKATIDGRALQLLATGIGDVSRTPVE
jgi:cytoskeleton protein RodZ